MPTFNAERTNLPEQLSQFRATHAYKRLSITGREWQYLISGRLDRDVLLLLPGAPGIAEMAFHLILRFEDRYRVLALSYPAYLETVEQLIAGIITLLDHERIDAAHIVGGSYSGMIAQCLVRRYPQRVKKLILDHTSPPTRKKARIYRLYNFFLVLLPLLCIRTLLRRGNHLFSQGNTPQQRFWRSYFDEVITIFTKEDYLSRIRVCIDFYQNYRFTSEDTCFGPATLLIIEAGNDSLVSVKERTALKALYPSAQVFTFSETGHSAWAYQFDTFFSVIANFLEEPL